MRTFSVNKINIDTVIFATCVIMTLNVLPIFYSRKHFAGIFILVTFIYFALKYPVYKVFKLKFVKILILFLFWSSFVSLFAKYDITEAIITQRKILGVVMFSLINIFFVFFNPERADKLFQIYFISLIILLVYLVNNMSILNNYKYNDRGSEYLIFDPNTIGYYVFNGVFAAFILFTKSKNKKVFTLILTALLFVSFYSVLSVASRGGMIIFIVSTFAYIFVIFNSVKGKIVKFSITLASLSIMLYLTIQIFGFVSSNTYLGKRIRMAENQESTRSLHIKEAIIVGVNNFLIGVGGGNYSRAPRNFERGSFSHCTYTEAFANYGAPGLIILFLLYFDFLYAIIKNIKYGKNKMQLKIFLVFLGSFMLYNVFYVTYLTIIFMGLFFGVRTYVNRINM